MTQRRLVDIPSLDGLRTISIGIVFAAHVGLEDKIPGGFGVTVFFVLSGYLITTLLRLEQDKSEQISLKRFYVRRIFRILPLFYAVLAMAVIASWFGLGTGIVHGDALAAQAGHVANFWGILNPGDNFIRGTGVYWSLAVEEHFYLLFPIAFLILNRAGLTYRRQAEVYVGVCVLVLAWRYVLIYGFDVSIYRTYYGSDTRLDSLLFGCVAALVANPVIDGAGQSKRRLTVLAAFGAVVILGTLALRDDGFRETARYTLQSVAIVAILRYVVAQPETLAGRLLNTRPMIWLGQLSYPFYLVHYVVILEVKKHVGALPVVAVISLAISLPLCIALRSLVERPAQRMRDRLLRSTPRPVANQAVAAGQ